jgi:probable HAF family extracellular repeat protein
VRACVTAASGLLAASLLLSFGTVGSGAAASPVVAIDLGTLGGDNSEAEAVNESGQVVGSSEITPGSVSPEHAFSWTPGSGMVDLGTLGGPTSAAVDVDDYGQVVGLSYTAGGKRHAFSWTPAGGMVDLGTLGGDYSAAVALNDDGQVVGTSTMAGDKTTHAFSWTAAGGMVDLGTLGGEASYPEAISDTGQVVGYSETAGGEHAFSWTADGGMVDLGTLGGNTSEAEAVNGHGEVVGFSELGTDTSYHAFLWTQAEGMVDLGTLGGSESSATDINDSGRVVGCANSSAFPMGGSYVMSWTRTEGMVNLGAGGCANRVNDSGQIVGFAPIPDDPHGAVRAFVATAAGGLVDLGTLGGRSTDAIDINDQGEVVGDADTTRGSHAAVWRLTGTTGLKIALAADRTTVPVDESVDVTVTVANSFPAAVISGVLRIALPAAATRLGQAQVDGGTGCTGTATLVCNLDTLAIGARATVRFSIALAEPGRQVVTSGVTAARPSDADNTSELALTVTPPPLPDLKLTLAADQTVVTVNRSVALTATVGNRGPTTADGGLLTITLPAKATLLGPPRANGGSGCTGTTTLSCDLDPLAPGAKATVRFAIALTGPGRHFVDAHVASAEGDAALADNTSQLTITATAPLPPAAVRPVLGKAVIVPRKPLAGRTATVALRAWRSDNGAALKSGKMRCDSSVAGQRIPHGASFENGIATVSLRIPKTAQGKMLRIRVTISLARRSSTRTATWKVR